ncbi:hypothetical protein NE237_015040 [Protea cynaroides]|uniref:Peptidase A1 domain-containing protein n=1 Tax=Protea cynaroides TaxID=273540 RepID=A0A9Q0QQV2_9MAGN|nr:hypothetical protein NE237_015040 [Protea cynaroides]
MKITQIQILLSLMIILPYVSSTQNYTALVSLITKDTITSLYTMKLDFNESYVIDLSSPFLWYHCPKVRYPRVSSLSSHCSQARSYYHLSPSLCTRPPKSSSTSCMVTPVNTVTKRCSSAKLTYKDLIIYWTDGRSPTSVNIFSHVYISCAPKSLLRSLPTGALGMASLSQSQLSLTTQFSSEVKKQFSLCLPSTNATPGVLFFGVGPFYMMPPTPFDVTTILSYTPLIKNLKALGYYIGLTGISIGGKRIQVPKGTFKPDRRGRGGVKLDTVVPYTALRRNIYDKFLEEFVNATKGVPRVKSVEPFDLCLNSTDLGYTRVGYGVPQIDLELANGKNWTIFGVNSMKQVNDEVACLAFVDGGEMADHAVVIGSFQMEDNFLMFDLVESNLGFSSTLYFIRTSCGNFNFTTSN